MLSTQKKRGGRVDDRTYKSLTLSRANSAFLLSSRPSVRASLQRRLSDQLLAFEARFNMARDLTRESITKGVFL